MRRRLHATDEAGRLIVGADVAIASWRVTAGESWLASLFGNRLMLRLTRFAYDRFADGDDRLFLRDRYPNVFP